MTLKQTGDAAPPADREHPDGGGHRWMMVACCIPMLAIFGVLIATGVAGAGAFTFVVVCIALMGMMMLAMPGGRRH